MKYALPLLALCLLSGCAHYHARPLAPEKSAAQLDLRRLDEPGLKVFIESNSIFKPDHWPLEKWDLDSLTLAAFYFHPDLAVARAQWQLAQAGVKTSQGRPNPTLAASPQYNTTTLTPTPWAPGLTFDLPIETAGKRATRITEAERSAEAARWNYVSAAWQIRSGVRAALTEWAANQSRLPLLSHQRAAQREIVRFLQGSFAAGETARPELTAAEIALGKMELDFSSAEIKLAEARSRLAQALGVTPGALESVALQIDEIPDASPKLDAIAARRAALLGRSDIRAALADYAATEAALQLEIAKQYPDVHFNPGYQYDQGDNKWTLGFTLELPVFNQNQGPIAEANARRALAAAKFLQLQSQVSAQLDRAVAGWRSAQAQLKTSKALGEAAARQQNAISNQRAVGVASGRDWATAEIEINSIRLAQLDSLTQVDMAMGALEDAVQQPSENLSLLKIVPSSSDRKSKP